MSPAISRRLLLQMLPLSAVSASMLSRSQPSAARGNQYVLLGTTGKVSKGIYRAPWNAATGELGPITLAAELQSPSFLALRRQGKQTLVYAVSESENADAKVTAFRYDAASGATLEVINAQRTMGDDPTHLSISPDGRALAVANYTGGSVTSYRLAADGSISAPVSHFQYEGHGPNTARQQHPHAHSAQFSPNGRFLLVNDLGLDQIHVYKVDAATATLTPNDPPFWTARPGSGPRHIAFHPGGRWLYSVNELDSTVDILRWHGGAGRMEAKGFVSTLPADFPPNQAFAGEIAVSRDGKNVYVGNRIASETIAVFDVKARGGCLAFSQAAPNGGKLTRHLVLDPASRWMLLSDQGSGTLVVLERDRATGRLSEPRHTYALDTVMFAAIV